MTFDLRDQLQSGLAGNYTLERELGGGGMSRVFVADDTSLGRKVVVKVLRADLAESLSAERFKREIQLAARLQHPHIVPLLAAGVLPSGALYYTMPFVDGESLRDRLDREGGLPVSDVTHLMRDVASALAYAHGQHIIHRDIKPENVLLSPGGAVVTDFGIAKAIHAARADTAGETGRVSTLTAAGTSLGTPAYMAPEQAVGDAVDHRADLYALGVVTYEMLAGRPPFDGRTAQRMLAAHASETPEPIDRRRPNVPPALGTLVMRLLEKHPADRPQTAGEVLLSLAAPPTASVATTPRRRDPLVVALALGLAASLGALAWMLAARNDDSTGITRARMTLELPADAKLNPGAGFGNSMAFSPNGESIVYVGGAPTPRLYLRRLDELSAKPIPGTERGVNPQFAPDGREIGFVVDLTLKAVPVTGGTPRLIARGAGRFAWGSDGTIVFSRPSVLNPRGGLWRVSAAGGTPVELTHPDSVLRRFQGSPIVLPDGRTVLFSSRPASGNPTLAAVRLDGDGKVTDLGVVGGSPVYVRGYIVFARADGTIAAVRFDAEKLEVIGEPVTVLDNIALKAGGAAELAVSSSGMLAYLSGIVGQQLIETDRRGVSRLLLDKLQNYRDPRVSPDGRRIALTIGPPPYSSDIWVYDIASKTLTRLTTGGTNANPAWTPDGRRIAWTSIGAPNATGAASAGGVWWQPWDASAPPELLVPGASGSRFTPGGDSIITSVDVDNANEVRLFALPYDAHRPYAVLLSARPEPRQPQLSPDGRWLAYISEETGSREVYIQPFPGPGGRFPISSGGGVEPIWGRLSSGVLYYRSGAAMIAATIAVSPSVTVLRRDTLFVSDMATGVVETLYDEMPNGHFVVVRSVASVTPPVVVFGWADELRERIDAARKR